MNKSLSFSSKKSAVASAAAIVVIAFTTGLSFVPRTASGGFDLEGLNQVVQDQGQTLKNHEARIQNNEADINKLQQDTGSTPATHTTVPAVSPTASPAPAANQAPAAPTRTIASQSARREGPFPPNASFVQGYWIWYCDRTWSDGQSVVIELGRVSTEGYGAGITYTCQSN